ncbi:MAG: NADH-quinone oxidoreductase subunit NuoK [Caldimicrobium sp.]|nr:NADH-quinone oxidoreductase subunit NuoK [Caldimicrobium sp.]MCX7874266.1 NADH-quinone oxidoreductase subunit NuoK [Caldimicrobium sp.]MDW8093927.1 NADH-quinone oxidoreductase subunit NuoK [Caldimicrobium sp.]
MVPFKYYVVLSLIIFSIGLLGVLLRKNLIIVLVSFEIIMNGLMIFLASVSYYTKDVQGYILVFFLLALAAVEAGVGLTLVVLVYRKLKRIYTDEVNYYRG